MNGMDALANYNKFYVDVTDNTPEYTSKTLELESIINAYSMLIDFQTQLNLSNTISNFDENADIEKVKEELLKLL